MRLIPSEVMMLLVWWEQLSAPPRVIGILMCLGALQVRSEPGQVQSTVPLDLLGLLHLVI